MKKNTSFFVISRFRVKTSILTGICLISCYLSHGQTTISGGTTLNIMPGQLGKVFTAAGSFLFPFGDATGTSEYSPVTLAFSSGTFAPGSFAGVSLTDAQYPGTATSYLSRYWNVTQTGIATFYCNTTFQYPVADVVGGESDIFICAFRPGFRATEDHQTVTFFTTGVWSQGGLLFCIFEPGFHKVLDLFIDEVSEIL
ncbi:MAG: hypothetical protein NTW16_01220 [Bacteroidetes bacterium]|nr:hypothetical protein [Bacteroidota bacterium]